MDRSLSEAFRLSRELKATGQWVREESSRRVGLQREDICGTYLLSYPRSGNHAVRYAIEFMSSRPTLGNDDHESYVPPKGLHDQPIFLRTEDLHVKDLRPIAVKRHRLRRIDKPTRLIYLERRPVDAILSHTGGSADAIEAEVRLWLLLRKAYAEFHPDMRLRISYGSISTDHGWILELANFLDVPFREEQAVQLFRLMDRAKLALRRPPRTTQWDSWEHRFPDEAALCLRLLEKYDGGD